MYAIKANRQTKITEDEKQKFIDAGYKIARLDGKELVFDTIETEESLEIEKLKTLLKARNTEIANLKKKIEAK